MDDTIHVISEYRTSREQGASSADACDSALQRTLAPIAGTTIVIGAGFAVLGISEFNLIRNLGLITATIMVICFLADVLLMPSLLVVLDRDPPPQDASPGLR